MDGSFGLVNSISPEPLRGIRCPPILKDKPIRLWWSKVEDQGGSDRKHFSSVTQDVTHQIMMTCHIQMVNICHYSV